MKIDSYVRIVEALNQFGGVDVITFIEGDRSGRKYLLTDEVVGLNDGVVLEGAAAEAVRSLRSARDTHEMIAEDVFRVGEETYFLESLQRKPRLFIIGAGHVGRAVAHTIAHLDFEVIVSDPREAFANRESFPHASKIEVIEPLELFEKYPPQHNDWYLIMTPGHSSDGDCAARVLERPHAYAGMIGSKGKAASVKRKLAERGFTQAQIDTIISPVGLPIGAKTPAEIGVSIAAQLIEFKYSKRVVMLEQPMIDAILEMAKAPEPCYMVTIMEKHGSGPREAGARMLVDAKGNLIAGTIGGGPVEYAAMQHVPELLAAGMAYDHKWYDLSSSKAATLGMVCGGKNHVMFEQIEA